MVIDGKDMSNIYDVTQIPDSYYRVINREVMSVLRGIKQIEKITYKESNTTVSVYFRFYYKGTNVKETLRISNHNSSLHNEVETISIDLRSVKNTSELRKKVREKVIERINTLVDNKIIYIKRIDYLNSDSKNAIVQSRKRRRGSNEERMTKRMERDLEDKRFRDLMQEINNKNKEEN